MNDFHTLIPAGFAPQLADAIAAICPIHRLEAGASPTPELAEKIRCLIWTPFGGALRAEHMAQFHNLELVATMGAGYEHIDVAAAAAQGVCVANTPNAVTEDTADAAFALVLDTVRRFPAAERYLRAGKWAAGKPFGMSASLRGKTLGVLGFGRIGKAVARRAEAFGLKIVYSGRRRQEDVSYPWFRTPEELARNCDILLNILPGGDATRGLVGRRVFEALGSDGFFVNIGRGGTVDEPALISALQTNTIAGAGLDIYAGEPHVPAELIALENVVLLPHVGGATHYVMQAVGTSLIANIRSFASGEGPLDAVPEAPWRGPRATAAG
jgi:lactate dehydrogenase-like 2-hydroxyacid dehydrogenase